MARINLSDNIHCRSRQLYLQTNTLEEESKIVSTLFDGGRVLRKVETPYDACIPDDRLSRLVETFHRENQSAISLLFEISTRIKTVRHIRSLVTLGRQFLRWNLLDETISELQLAIQYDATCGEAYYYLGEAYLRRGGVDEAIQILKKGIEVAPDYADLQYRLGKAHHAAGEFDQALKLFDRALEINPEYEEPHFAKALCLVEMMAAEWDESGSSDQDVRFERVKDNLSRVAAKSSRFRIPAFEEAMRQLHRRHITKTLDLMRQVERDLPKMIDLDFHDIFYLNVLYGERGRDRKAVDVYIAQLEALIRKHPTYPDLQNMLGVACLIQCRNVFNRSLRHFQKACDLNPDFERAQSNLKLAKNDGKGLLILLRALLK